MAQNKSDKKPGKEAIVPLACSLLAFLGALYVIFLIAQDRCVPGNWGHPVCGDDSYFILVGWLGFSGLFAVVGFQKMKKSNGK